MQPTRTSSRSIDTVRDALGSIDTLHSSSATYSFSLHDGQTHCEACRVQIPVPMRTSATDVTLDSTPFPDCQLQCR